MLELTAENFTTVVPNAMCKSSANQIEQGTALYRYSTFKMEQYRKGPLVPVWDLSTI